MSSAPPSFDSPGSASLLDLPLREALTQFGGRSPTPGAGSAAALTGSLAARLARASDRERRHPALDQHHRRLCELAEEDAAAFRRFWDELSAEPSAGRPERLSVSLRQATEVPLGIAASCLAVAEIARELVSHGLPAARAEAVTAEELALAAGRGACFVARENLRQARRAAWAEPTGRELAELEQRLEELGRPEARRSGPPAGG